MQKLQNQGIIDIVGAHFQDSVNPITRYFRLCKLMAYSKFSVIIDSGDPENQTQTEEVQNDNFVKTVHY